MRSEEEILKKLITALLLLILVFFIAAGVQIIYLLIFLFAFNKKHTHGNHNTPPVSVIVCAHDEEENLQTLIPQLLAQEYFQFEVIVINDRSNDGTYDYLQQESKRHSRLRTVNVHRTPPHVNGKKYGLTLGIRAATYDWILLTDADCRPNSKNWIARMSSKFDDHTQFVLGLSPYLKNPGFLNLFIRFESLITAVQYFAFALLKNPYMGVGRNLAYRKSLFLEKKGFSTHLGVTGGDDDLFVNQHATATNTGVQFEPEAQVFSVPKTTWSAFFQQKIRHLAVGKRYLFKHRLLLGAFTATWILTWFTGISLLIWNPFYYWIIIAMILREALLVFTIRALVKQANLTFELWALPFLDFLYSIYYISTGLVASLTKKIRWRN